MGNVAENKQDSARAKVMRRARRAHLGETGSRVFNALIALVLCAGICMPDPTSLAYAREVALSAASGASNAAGQAEPGASGDVTVQSDSAQEAGGSKAQSGGSGAAAESAPSSGSASASQQDGEAASAADASGSSQAGEASGASQAGGADGTSGASDASGSSETSGASSSSDSSASSNTSEASAAAADSRSSSASRDESSSESTSSASAEDAEDAEAAEAAETKTLKKSVKFADGKRYTVQVEYGADAGIPDGAELALVQIIQKPSDSDLKKEENKDRPYDTERFASKSGIQKRLDALKEALDVEDDDLVFFAEYLDVSITADGKEVQPQAPVKATVATDAIGASEAPSIEAAALVYNKDKKEFDGTQLEVEDESTQKEGAKVSFEAGDLPEVALAGVATPIVQDDFHGQQVEVLGPRGLEDFGPRAVQAQGLADDQDLQAAYWVSVTPDYRYHTALWVRVDAAEGAEPDEAGTLEVYRLADDGTVSERLAGQSDQGRAAQVESGESIAVVWEKSFRDTKLDLGEVTLEGAMPVDASGEAKDVTGEYEDPASVVESAPQVVQAGEGEAEDGAEAEAEAGQAGADAATQDAADAQDATPTPVEVAAAAGTADAQDATATVETIAAYDISIQAAGADYQPGDDRPVTVTITNDGISADKNLQVWHVMDDGTVEVIDDFTVDGNAITFEATGFSTYMVVYTVDFHWGGYTYNLEGGSEIFLSELLDILLQNGGDDSDDSARLAEIAQDLGQVENVEFSNPDLMQVDEVQIMEGEPELVETDDSEELIENSRQDWRLWSLAPFSTDETLAITCKDGTKVEIHVTDETRAGTAAGGGRVTAAGITYTLNNANNTATVYAVANNSKFYDKISYNGKEYTVVNIRRDAGVLTRNKNDIDIDLVKRIANNYSFTLPTIKTQPDPDPVAEDGTLVAGDNNDSSDYKVWKKAEYNPATNSIDYTMKYFQAMKKNVPIDFIFIYDDSASMYSGTRYSNGVGLGEAQATRVMILDAVSALLPKQGESQKADYDIRVYLGGASTGHTTWDGPYDTYDAVATSLSTYRTGTTRHATGVKNALEIAQDSVKKKRNPVVIYLSDFHQPGTLGAAGRSTAASLHRIAQVYALSTDYAFTANDATRNIPSGASYMHQISGTQSDALAQGVKALESIIKEAIGYYMKDKVTITDNLSDALQGQEAGVGTISGGANAGSAPAGKGKSTWTIGGSSPYPGAGTVYTENFSVQLDDSTVYAGATPTNGKATIYVGGKEVNGLEPNPDDPTKLHLGGEVSFLVGKLDEKNNVILENEENGIPKNLILDTVQFSLTKEGEDEPIDTYTVENGAFTIPFTKDGKVILELGGVYYLSEVETSVDGDGGYNKAASRNPANLDDPKLKQPDKSWVLTVGQNGVIKVAPEYAANQTPEATIAKAAEGKPARFVLWNKIVVPAKLIPLEVKKTWNGGEKRDSVPFTIYGVERSDDTAPGAVPGKRHKLVAYDGYNAETAGEVSFIGPGNKGFHADGDVWTQKVYVLDQEDDHKFYDSTNYVNLNDLTDGMEITVGDLTLKKEQWAELDDDGDGKVPHGQSYSYAIEEGNLVYDEGWYTPAYGNNATATTMNVRQGNVPAKTADTEKSWMKYVEDYGGETSDDYMFQLDIYGYTYKESDKASFKTSAGLNNYDIDLNSEKKSFFQNLRKIEAVIEDDGTYYRVTIPVGGTYDYRSYSNTNTDGYYTYGNALFFKVRLPKSWADKASRNASGVIQNNGLIRRNVLPIHEIYVTFKDGKSYVLYGDGEAKDNGKLVTRKGKVSNSCTWGPFGPNQDADHATAIRVYEQSKSTYSTNTCIYNNDIARGINPNEQTLEIYAQKQSEPAKTVPATSYTLNSCTLDITNTWERNPLIPITVKKEWKDADTDPAADYGTDKYDAKRDVTFSLKGSTERGGVKDIPIFTEDSEGWYKGTDGGSATGTIAKTADNQNNATWEQTFYAPRYDTSTYQRNSDNTADVQEYAYDKTSLSEADLSVDVDDDGEPKGEWDKDVDKDSSTYTASEIIPAHEVNATFGGETVEGLLRYSVGKGKDENESFNETRYIRIIYPVSVTIEGKQENCDASILIHLKQNTDIVKKEDGQGYRYEIYGFNLPKVLVGTGTLVKSVEFLDSNKNLIGNGNLGTDKQFYGIYRNDRSSNEGKTRITGNYSWVKFSDTSGNKFRFCGPAESDVEVKVMLPETTGEVEKECPLFTLTNTYTPYKAVTLSSTFQDGSDDKDNTDAIKKVTYTIRDSEGKTVRTTSLPASGSGGNVSTGTKTIYLPKGNYTITQSYFLGSEENGYALDGEMDAYTVSAPDVSNAVYSAYIDSDRAVAFANSRKVLPVQVKMDWEPGLQSGENPLGNPLKYDIRTDGKPDPVYSGELTAPDQVNDHNGLPTYSVREVLTECALSDENMKDALPDYDLGVVPEEADGKLVFTIQANIKRAAVIVEKTFDEAFRFEDYKGAVLTYTLVRSDGGDIYGTGTKSVTLTMTVPDTQPGTMTGEFLLNGNGVSEHYAGLDAKTQAVYEDKDTIFLPVIRKADRDQGVKYVLSEAVTLNGKEETYFPSFSDLTDNADSAFEQTNPAGKNVASDFGEANTAKFFLTWSGIIVGVGNANSPYICKIVESFGEGENKTQVEVPFRRLNAAVDYARTYGNGQEMSADNPVTIEMLVDYVIPSDDNVTLDQPTDNIVFTTAATTGGVYNFVDTQAGKADADKGASILTRGFSGSSGPGEPLFTVGNGSLAFTGIILDGDKEGKTTGTPQNGRAISVTAGDSARGSLTVGAGTTVRNFKLAHGEGTKIDAKGGAINAEAKTTVTVEGAEDARVVFEGNEVENTNVTDSGDNMGADGGAIAATTGCMLSVKHADFTGNKATGYDGDSRLRGNGGAIALTDTRSGDAATGLSVENATFTGNTASNSGGAIRTGEKTEVTLTGCTFSGNSTSNGEGGAVNVLSKQNEVSALTISGGSFTGNAAATNGGAVKIGGYGTLTVKDGAKFGDDAEGSGNTATDGGAIYVAPNATATVSDATIAKNAASRNGGGIYGSGKLDVLSGVTIRDCTAQEAGGGVYVADRAEMFMSGGVVERCSSGNGGAVDVGGAGARLNFSGNPQIADNATADGQQKNVVLPVDSNDVINTVGDGLDEGARIGVYVVDGADTFDKHGVFEQDFGTHADSDAGKANLDCFTNDRNSLIGEACPVDGHGTLIRWTSYVCKLTDADGRLLYTDAAATKPAVYKTLKAGFADTQGTQGKKLYNANGAEYTSTQDHDIFVKMLKDYTMGEVVTNVTKQRNYTFTTAEPAVTDVMKAERDPFVFNTSRDTDTDRAIVKRGFDGGSLIKFNVSSHTFAVSMITLDGNKEAFSATDNGGLIAAQNGIVEIHGGTTMRNSKTTGAGGAVNATGASLRVLNDSGRDILFEGCEAGCEGGALGASKAITIESSDSASIVFNDCSAGSSERTNVTKNGGAVCATEGVAITGTIGHPVIFTCCRTVGYGGGIFSQSGKLNLTHAVFGALDGKGEVIADKACYSSASNGGAIATQGKAITVTDCKFYGCHADATNTTSGGGAIHSSKNVTVKTTDGGTSVFKGCYTSFGSGGAIYAGGETNKIENGVRFDGCSAGNNGGAVFARGTNTISNNVTFDGCSAGNTGGAVYASGTSQIKDNVTINGCSAKKDGGAIFVNAKSKNTISGVTIQNCTAQTNGGGISAGDNSQNAISNARIQNCTAGNFGGGIYLGSNAKCNTADINDGEGVSGNNTEIEGNEAKSAGAGIYVAAGANLLMKDAFNVRNNGTGKTAFADGSTGKPATGGGLYIVGTVTLAGNPQITGNRAADAGAAMYVVKGGTLTLTGSPNISNHEIEGSINDKKGPAIYLAQDGTLNLEGNPTFSNNLVRDTNYKQHSVGTPRIAMNGEDQITETVWQDIYLAGYDNADATSIVVTGNLTGGAGSIRVWAEKQSHYEMLKQFATIKDGASISDDSYLVFRNAEDNGVTNCGGGYLTGQKGEKANYIYWTGGFDVVFLKESSFGEALPGATFTLYSDEACTTPFSMSFADGKHETTTSSDGSATYKDKDGREQILATGEVLLSKIPPKTFFLKETDVPDGYAQAPLYKVEVDSQGNPKMWVKSGDTWVDAPQLNGRYVVMNVRDGSLKTILKKTGDNSAPLDGAQFRIFRADLTEVTGESGWVEEEKDAFYRSDATGAYFMGNLPYGKYYLLETKAPGGYDGNDGKVFILRVDENGVKTVKADGTATPDAVQQVYGASSADKVTAFKTWAAS